MKEKALYTTREAAAVVCCHIKTLRDYITELRALHQYTGGGLIHDAVTNSPPPTNVRRYRSLQTAERDRGANSPVLYRSDAPPRVTMIEIVSDNAGIRRLR